MAVQHRPLHSSHIQSAGYDPDTEELHVTFKRGGTYVYKDVPQSAADDFFDAPSHGKHLQSEIIGTFTHHKL